MMSKEELLDEFTHEFNIKKKKDGSYFMWVHVCKDCLSPHVKGYYECVIYHNSPDEYEAIDEQSNNECDSCGNEYCDILEVRGIEEYKELLKEKYG